jgi:O-acetyl-ADP-ribose deacetylase (regulator of RNase III)
MIIFASLNSEWCSLMRAAFANNPSVRIVEADIRTIPQHNTVFVSPANSLGFMDGGIDLALSRDIFPRIQRRVQERIRQIGLQTALGRYYLPVGSTVYIPVPDTYSGLIVAPTMFLPHCVSETQNAYWSALAAFMTHKKCFPAADLVLTSHCCGYGGMSAATSAEQMKRAYEDILAGATSPILKEEDDMLLFPNRDDEQPDNYDNREIKELTITTNDYVKTLMK